MSDIKSVIALLCKHLNLSIGASFKPEYFRLAKYNKGDEDVIQALWTVLHTLSHYAVKDEAMYIDYDRYDDLHATKLYFAFLQYPAMDFYALSRQNMSCSRELLLALGWLVAIKNALNIAIREALTNSVLGQEYSSIEDTPISSSVGTQEKGEFCGSPTDAKSQMHNIALSCGRVGHNVKEIAELMREKIKLTTKIHAASLNTSGLPHLSVFQAALTKKIHNRKDFTKKDDEALEGLRSVAAVLEIHSQWIKVEHVFYDWMVSVIEESRSDKDSSIAEDRCSELSNFLSLLRHVTKKKLHSPMTTGETSLYEKSCTSRLLRTPTENTEAELWNSKTAQQLITVEADVKTKMSQLTSELRKMVKSIANCVEI